MALIKEGYNLIQYPDLCPEILEKITGRERRTIDDDDTRAKIVKKAILTHAGQMTWNAVENYKRSSVEAEALCANIERFQHPYHPVIKDDHYMRAIHEIRRITAPAEKFRPVSIYDIKNYPWTKSVSACAPFTYMDRFEDIVKTKQKQGLISDGRISFGNLFDEIFEYNIPLLEKIMQGEHPFWHNNEPKTYEFTTIFGRGYLVEKGAPEKVRPVMGVTKLMLMSEQIFIYPLTAHYLNGRTSNPLLWGYETTKGGWLKLIKDWDNRNINVKTTISVDWSGFDQRALHSLIDEVHDMWESFIDFENGWMPSDSTSATRPPTTQELRRLWRWMKNSAKHTPIVMPDGKMYGWTHNGIASGFQQTQLLDSFVNLIMILTCLSEMGLNINDGQTFNIKVQGDDSIVVTSAYLDVSNDLFLEKLAEIALRRFNAKLSVEKSSIRRGHLGATVLSYTNKFGVSYRNDVDLLARLRYPERSYLMATLPSACVGIALASMGTSDVVYNVCKAAYETAMDWLRDKGIEPRQIKVDMERRIQITNLPLIFAHFPSQDYCLLQNYSTVQRSDEENEKLWPLKYSNHRGFRFHSYY